MRSTFFGIEIGRRALDAHRKALEVTGHNIANATVEGYSRQRVEYRATSPYCMPGMNQPSGALQLGTGVHIQTIGRMREAFLDGQVRQEHTALGKWEKSRDLLQQIEVIFCEPSESGLRTVMEKFWTSLYDLANYPESSDVRATVLERGQALADTFRHLWSQLSQLQASLDNDLRGKVETVNALASEIAALNDEISTVSGSGQQANDLMDRRDMLLDELSGLAEVNVVQGPSDTVSVYLSGGALVSGNHSNALETQFAGGSVTIQWKGSHVAFCPSNGEISTLLLMRDTVIPGFKDDLDLLATAITDRVNEVHAGGMGLDGSTGLDFFQAGAGAAGMALSSDVLNKPEAIAASASGEVGDGSNALQIARVGQEVLVSGVTPGDYYRSFIAHLGIRAQEASRMAENQQVLVEHLEERRQMAQGVSLDEEMTNLIRYQHAYSAAARWVNTVDQMLDTIVNRLGYSGR